jgi:hypothetical protein
MKSRPPVAPKDLPSLKLVPVEVDDVETGMLTPPRTTTLPLCMSVERKHFGWKNIKTALPTRRRPLRVTSRLGAKRDLEEDRMRPVAVRNGIASMEGKYNPACKWLEFHYPVAFRTFLNVRKLYFQEILKSSLIIILIYPFSRNMPKLKPASLEYSNSKI